MRIVFVIVFFFFKQKTAYEISTRDWSSDVCSSDLFVWWDPRKRERLGPECGYPRFGTHALAESFLLGAEVFRAAKRHAPVTRSILSITNSRDPAVNTAATRAMLRRWARHANVDVREFRFGRRLGPLHDVI